MKKFALITALLAIKLSLLDASNLRHWSLENEIDDGETHPIISKSPASELQDEIDILKLINVTAKDPGVSLVEGPISNYPAYKFRLPFGNVPLSNSTAVTSAMSGDSGFTVVFLYRQQKNNLGTLLSINSPGRLTPWFQLTSNSRTGRLSLKYRTNSESRLRQIEWNLPVHHRKAPLAAWTWMSLSSDFITNTLRLDLDCQPSKFEPLDAHSEHSYITIPQDSLVYFRQEPGRKKKFLNQNSFLKEFSYYQNANALDIAYCDNIEGNIYIERIDPNVNTDERVDAGCKGSSLYNFQTVMDLLPHYK